MSATDIWIKDLNVLESAWNEFLKSGKVNKGKHKASDPVVIDTCSEINDDKSDILSPNQAPTGEF